MASYIRDLQDKVTAARSGLDTIGGTVRDWQGHLQNCPKYQGTEPDGSRKDWLSVADVSRILDEIARAVSDVQFSL